MISVPSSIRSLRSLINQIPDKLQTKQAFRDLMDDPNPNDRAVGIVAASLLESALENTLVFKLKKIGASDTNEIFRGDAPFGTFEAKIKLARCISLIGKPAQDDLDCIRQIRSAFVYTKRAKITFETPEVANVCVRINYPIFGPDVVKHARMPHIRFFSACLLYSEMLLELATPGNHPSSRQILGRTWKYE